MSDRYSITLTSTKSGEEERYQLFGNGDYFQTFHSYLRSVGAEFEDDDPFFEDFEIPSDLSELIKAIDEAVWNDVVAKNEMKVTKDEFDENICYSKIFDFSPNILTYDKQTKEIKAKESLFRLTSGLAANSYLFASYDFVNWLNEQGAVVEEKWRWTQHSYQNNDKVPTVMGKLHPDYKLTISYYQAIQMYNVFIVDTNEISCYSTYIK